MKQGTSKALILIVMLASTIAAMVLRQMQLIRVFDADGLPISGSPITYALAAICVVTLAALLLLLRRTPPRQEYYCSIFSHPPRYDSDAVGCARRRCRQLDSVRRLDRSHPGTHLRG